MRVLVVGGGSGGHITPAMAVVREILEEKPRARIEFWTDRKYYKNVLKLATLGEAGGELPIRVKKVWSGKFRRYAGWSFLDYFRNFKITLVDLILKNFLGMIGFLCGIVQSFVRLIPKGSRPDVVFLKGGFVGLPVGMVSRWLRIPYVIHESDATPGLANRILMRKADKVAMGVRFETNDENGNEIKGREKWVWTGIPIGKEFRKVGDGKQKSLKNAFGFDESKTLVVITGGSQGSEHLNAAVKEILPDMLKTMSVGLIAGRKHYEQLTDLKKYEVWEDAKLKSNFRMWEFHSTMNELLGAADIVISRAGATTIAELAALGKSVVLIPFEKLPGGHQVKNAERLVKLGAAKMIVDEEMVKHPRKLLEVVQELARKPAERKRLAETLHGEAKLDSAKILAGLVIDISEHKIDELSNNEAWMKAPKKSDEQSNREGKS